MSGSRRDKWGFEGKREKERDIKKAAGVHHRDDFMDSMIYDHYQTHHQNHSIIIIIIFTQHNNLFIHILLPPNPSSKPAKRTTNNNKKMKNLPFFFLPFLYFYENPYSMQHH